MGALSSVCLGVLVCVCVCLLELPAVVTYFTATLCSVLQRDSAVLVLLAPCCTLSPAGTVAVPAFGRLQRCAPPLGLQFSMCVYGCALQRVWVMCYHCCAVCAA
jgi:hypothetical protein